MTGIDHLQSHPNSLHQLLAMSFRRFGHKTSSKRKDCNNAGKLNKSKKKKGNTKGKKQKRQHKGRKTQKMNQKRKKERRVKHEKL
jgi:hypothetical protein